MTRQQVDMIRMNIGEYYSYAYWRITVHEIAKILNYEHDDAQGMFEHLGYEKCVPHYFVM